MTTFNTPFGRYRWLRMPFGINSAPEVWQQRMNEIIEGLPGTEVIADDFLVAGFGDTVEEATKNHDENLRKLLQRARERGLKMNLEKIKLRKSEVRYIGHLLTAEGLKIDPEKVKALLEMPVPKDKAGVARFIGFVKYLSEFLEQLSEVTAPIRELEKQDVEFCWMDVQQKAFEKIKKMASTAPVLKYYDPEQEVTIQADASQSGLGYALMQEGQPVSLGARAMTPAEENYAQIEKEMLAIVVACEKFDQYIYGKHTIIESDHKPLSAIYEKPLHAAPKRLQRMIMRLQKYDLEIRYKPGSEMYLADTLSRAYPGMKVNTVEEHFCHTLEDINLTEELSLDEQFIERIKQETEKDDELQTIISLGKYGWPRAKKDLRGEAHAYFAHRHELSTQNGLLFKMDRIVIPKSMRSELIHMFHATHIGVEGCLRRARECYFWPLMNSEVKDFVSQCSVCNTLKPEQCKEPLLQHDVPYLPWSKVGTYIFQYDQRDYLVLVDYLSNWIEVELLKNITSKEVIREMQRQFARHGIPDVLVSDNGRQFVSEEFEEFTKKYRIQHVTSSPHFPQSHGKAEAAVKICKTMFRRCHLGGEDIYIALLDYRNTPSAEIGCSPAQLMYRRRTRTLLPIPKKKLNPEMQTGVNEKLKQSKARQAELYNRSARPLPELKEGEIVRMKPPGEDMWTKARCIAKAKQPRSYIVECRGRRYRRNRRQLRSTVERNLPDQVPYDADELPELPPHRLPAPPTPARQQPPPRTPARTPRGEASPPPRAAQTPPRAAQTPPRAAQTPPRARQMPPRARQTPPRDAPPQRGAAPPPAETRVSRYGRTIKKPDRLEY